MVSQEIKSEIEKVLNSKCGMMVQWKGIEKILLDAGLAYEQELGPERFLVHPQNRGGTGINAFNCHSKGAAICSTGADLSQFAGSVAFETNPKTKQKQVSFTASLAKESDGLGQPHRHGKVSYCLQGPYFPVLQGYQVQSQDTPSKFGWWGWLFGKPFVGKGFSFGYHGKQRVEVDHHFGICGRNISPAALFGGVCLQLQQCHL